MFELILLWFRVISIFTGFTFTDIEDFGPLLSLIIGLIAVALVCCKTQEKASYGLIALMVLLSLWPLLPNLGLYFLAREVQARFGSWPQVMIDDPKNLYGHVSPHYNALFHLVDYLEAFSGAWMVIFLSLFFGAKSCFSRTQQRLFLGLMLASVFLVLIDPGNLYAWWMD